MQHIARHIREPVTSAVVEIGQLLVIDSQQMKHGGVEVVDGDAIHRRPKANFIKLSKARAAFDAGTRHEHPKPMRIMIAAAIPLGDRHAAKLTSPDDQGVVNESGALEISQQGVNRLVRSPAVALVIAVEIAVRIPFAIAVDLHEAHPALDEAPRHQAFGAKGPRFLLIESIHFSSRCRFIAEIHQVRRLRLHAISQLKTLDAPQQFGLTRRWLSFSMRSSWAR